MEFRLEGAETGHSGNDAAVANSLAKRRKGRAGREGQRRKGGGEGNERKWHLMVLRPRGCRGHRRSRHLRVGCFLCALISPLLVVRINHACEGEADQEQGGGEGEEHGATSLGASSRSRRTGSASSSVIMRSTKKSLCLAMRWITTRASSATSLERPRARPSRRSRRRIVRKLHASRSAPW